MKVDIKIWGHYDREGRTPLIGEKTVEVADEHYHDALVEGRAFLKETGGKSGHFLAHGKNSNYASRFFHLR